MRLTLRTLLAYRDRVLNPAELEDMHARVQQNAMAGNLIKRIDALSQRANILAPPIDGKGLGADANSIAEYLDDSLKGDRVPELERICLESDVQLAELAQCHYLLSTALSTPVEVQPALRWRIAAWGDPTARQKALADRPTGLLIEPELKTGSADGSSGRRRKSRFRTEPAHNAPVQAVPAQIAPAQHDSPQTESGVGNAAVNRSASAAASSDGNSAVQAGVSHSGVSEGKTANNHHLRLVTAQPVEAPMVASGGDSIRPSGLDLEGSHMAHEVPEYLRGRSRDGWRGPLAIGGLVAILCLLVWQSMGSLSSVREMFTMRPPQIGNGQAAHEGTTANGAANAANSEVNSAVKNPNAANVDPSVGSPAVAPGSPFANGEASRLENGRAPEAVANSQPTGATPAEQSGLSPTESSSNNPSSNPGNVAGGSAAGPSAAHWLPADANAMQSVLLVQSIGGGLHRLEPTESMPIGTQIFVPPANRPTLDLNAGPLWTVCGMTHMELAGPDAGASASMPHIGLRLGRAVVRESPRGRSLALSSPAGTASLTLNEAGSELAVDLSYQPVAYGQATNRAAHAPVLTLSMLAGSSTVEFGGRSIKLPAGHTVMLQANLAAQPTAAESPVWIDPANDRPVDQLAALDLARQMTNDRSIGESLKELSTNRRPEMRALAAQTLSLLGNWDWVASPKGSLSDARDRSFWTPLLDGTRQILAAHPENVEALQSALQLLDADAVGWRTDMWLGLDSAQLSGDGLSKLVKTLESDILLDRILAIYHLQRVTGKDLGYQAGEPNRAAISQWTRELTNGRLTPTPL